MKIVKIVDCVDSILDDLIITVRSRFLFWTWETSYRGSCTTWDRYPSGSMVLGQSLRRQLYAIWKQRMWEKDRTESKVT